MPRKPSRPPVVCEFFTWRLLRRDGVIYADGRTGKHNSDKHNLGKHSLGTRDADKAIANLRVLDRQKAVELGLAPAASVVNPASLSLASGWEVYLANCQASPVVGGVAPSTLKRYRAVRDKHLSFCAKLGIRSWQEINKTNTKQYGNWLHGQDYADRSIYLELNQIKSALSRLIEEGILPEACRFKLPLSKPIGTDTYCYMPGEVNAMVRLCRSRPALHWLAAVIVGLACTGMRIGELASLRWSDVDFDSRTILLTDERASSRRRKLGQVRTTKGKRNRSVPICKELLTVLKALKNTKHADGRIFHGPRGGILKPDTVRNIFLRDIIEPLKAKFPTPPGEIGFEHGRLHSFRHYFCSQAFRDGVSEAELMAWLGWRDSKMVAHYRHLRREDGQRKIDEIDFLGRATARGGRANKVV